MIMPPGLRRLALAAHVACSVGMLGAVAAFLALTVAGLGARDPLLVREAYVAMELVAWYVIAPLVLAALVTGLIQALGTRWGLFRHYWVLAKLLVTAAVAVVLTLQLHPISHVAAVAAAPGFTSVDLRGLRISLVVHAAGGLLVLLIPVALSLYKPKGMTRYGWRRHHEGE